MTALAGGRKIDRSLVQQVGGVELGDLGKARGEAREMGRGARLERPIMMVPLEQIKGESALQSRQEGFDPELHAEDAELLASIQENGVLEPIMLARESAPGAPPIYNIVFGHRRRAAAEMAGLESIPAIIAKAGDDVGVLTLAENVGGRGLTPYERAVGLTRLKEQRPELTQVELAKLAGISQSTVSNLLRAYGESTPALRGLFAEGMDARAVVEVQPTFAGLPEREQAELGERLRGASRRDVRGAQSLIGQGVKPQAAVVTTMGTTRGKETAEERPEPPGGEAQLKALAEETGAPLRSVKGLAEKAAGIGAGREALRLACVYTARGGKDKNAIRTAASLGSNGKVARLVTQQLQWERRVRTLVDQAEDDRAQRFLATVFFGGGRDGTSR
jgi:ParB family chromosome partitioning protein